jgi:hypothetical protein
MDRRTIAPCAPSNLASSRFTTGDEVHMAATHGSIAMTMLASVWVVSSVSAFAQSDSARDRLDPGAARQADDGRSSHAAVRVYAAAPDPDNDVAPAANVSIATPYRQLVASMLARSATFRRQYARLGRALQLSVVVRSDMPPGRRMPALTQITARRGGGVEAVVHIPPSAQAIELIAHEFEHIIERLDGVNLRAKARLRASGVRVTADDDAYETTRAVVTGRKVVREVRGAGH